MNVHLYAYGSKSSLDVMEKLQAKLQAGEYLTMSTIYVSKKTSSHPILSKDTSKKLNLVKYSKEFMVKKVGGNTPKMNLKNVRPEVASMIQEHKEEFRGKIGKSNTCQAIIMIDKSFEPVVQKNKKDPLQFNGKG